MSEFFHSLVAQIRQYAARFPQLRLSGQTLPAQLNEANKKMTKFGKTLIMTRQAIIEKTIKVINRLPEARAEEISDFADFVMKRFEETQITQGIHKLVSNGEVFNFLNDEEDLYSADDLKEKYND